MHIETYLIAAHGWVPNNARLPVILYCAALPLQSCERMAEAFEAAFAHHGWPAQWRDGIYNYDHYHSTAHEVLGVAAGSALVILGGPDGIEVTLSAGDALLLPTGTGHRAQRSSDDFLVVGGYPEGQQWDICREAPSEEARRRMAALPFPGTDPVAGMDGPLARHWR